MGSGHFNSPAAALVALEPAVGLDDRVVKNGLPGLEAVDGGQPGSRNLHSCALLIH
jgi:hypothetical protein